MRDAEIGGALEEARELGRRRHVEGREILGELVQVHGRGVYVRTRTRLRGAAVLTDADPVSFVGSLALDLRFADGLTHGSVVVQPEMLAPGTDRLRVGVLATLVDMVAGFLPTGPVNPTVDLRVSLLARPPSSGTVHLVCRPATLGRRLFVGETLLHTGDVDRPFARSTTTFMNESMGASSFGAPPPVPIGAP